MYISWTPSLVKGSDPYAKCMRLKEKFGAQGLGSGSGFAFLGLGPKPVKSRIYILSLWMLFLVGCSNSTENAADFIDPIPFLFHSSTTRQIEMAVDVDTLTTTVRLDGAQVHVIPNHVLPQKFLDVDEGLFVIGRTLFSGELRFTFISSIGQVFPVEHTMDFSEFAFLFAIRVDSQVIVGLSDPIHLKNYLVRFVQDPGHFRFSLDTQYKREFGEKIGSDIQSAQISDKVYLCARDHCQILGVEFDPQQTSELMEVVPGLDLVEFKAEGEKIFGIYRDRTESDENINGHTRFYLVDILAQTKKPLEGIPFDLRFENGDAVVSFVEKRSDVLKLFLHVFQRSQNSGLLQLGSNNMEGGVVWGQVYYLNAYMDLLLAIDETHPFYPIRSEIRSRLELEIQLLDKLLKEPILGLLTKRYSMAREPLLFAVHSARVLRVFKRYLREIKNPLSLSSYESLFLATQTLDGHVEEVRSANSAYAFLEEGVRYLFFKKGSAFIYDGIELPYNQGNDWAGAVLHSENPAEVATLDYALTAKDVVATEILKEFSTLPADYEWYYWWGHGRAGWLESDGLSQNTPSYIGWNGLAHISYRVIDAMAILSVGLIYPEILPDGLVEYFNLGVEKGEIYPFLAEDLKAYGLKPNLPMGVIQSYSRPIGSWELQNAVWAYDALIESLPN